MTESQKWRPPLAPKPTLQVPTVRQRDISPALRGATAAFSPAPPVSSAPVVSRGTNGALGAATIAERAKREQDQKILSDNRDARSPVRGRLPVHRTGEHQNQLVSRNPLQRTASEIAATKATSASSSPVRSQLVIASHERSSIPTRSSSRESTAPRRGRAPPAQSWLDARIPQPLPAPRSPPKIETRRSPQRPQLNLDKMPVLTQPNAIHHIPLKPASKPESRSFLQDTHAPITKTKAEAPSPPPKRQPTKARQQHVGAEEALHSLLSSTVAEQSNQSTGVPKRDDTPLRASLPVPVPQQQSGRISPRASHPVNTSSRSPYGSMTAHSLADAMVASSLASRQGSRAASPAKNYLPTSPRRRSKSMDLLRPSHTGDKTAPPIPLPRRPMRQTMRKHSPEEEEEEEDTKRGRRHYIRKHPNKHHEGDRKRWRDKITERERKRFEGVWAANRGSLHEYEMDAVKRQWPRDVNSDDLVLNVVVREVWSRSRLPPYALEEIWDLVSPDPHEKALDREQFVVGLWLVDQRLKGRKLPVKVSPSVWASVRHAYVGIKVKSKPF